MFCRLAIGREFIVIAGSRFKHDGYTEKRVPFVRVYRDFAVFLTRKKERNLIIK